jgi:hypothetical protein
MLILSKNFVNCFITTQNRLAGDYNDIIFTAKWGESLNSHKLILNICHAEGTSLLPFFRDKVEGEAGGGTVQVL